MIHLTNLNKILEISLIKKGSMLMVYYKMVDMAMSYTI